jgi:hypothetical protein
VLASCIKGSFKQAQEATVLIDTTVQEKNITYPTDAINLSAIAAGTGGFVINGESASDRSGTKPPVLVPAAMADKLIAVLSCLPKITYDLPAFGFIVLIQAVNQMQVNRMSCLANKTTPMPLTYQPLPLAQAALLSMASQRVILVVTQSPTQAMSTAMV